MGSALAWFTRELPVLLGTARQAEAGGDGSSYPGLLLWTMVNYLDRRGLWLDWLDLQRRALQTATATADLRGQATAHRGLEHAFLQLGHHDDADTHGHCALALYRQLGDQAGEAQTHLALGKGTAVRGDIAAGLEHFLVARTLYKSIGHEAGCANALNNAGYGYVMLGQYDKALSFCEQAVEIQESVGDRHLLGYSWDSLGFAHHNLEHYEQAIACYNNALPLVRENGDRYAEAETLTHLGDTYSLAGIPRTRAPRGPSPSPSMRTSAIPRPTSSATSCERRPFLSTRSPQTVPDRRFNTLLKRVGQVHALRGQVRPR